MEGRMDIVDALRCSAAAWAAQLFGTEGRREAWHPGR